MITLDRNPMTADIDRVLDQVAQTVMGKVQKKTNGNLVGFWWNVRFSPLVSNSHASPVGFPRNWDRKVDRPLGYPGWLGRVWVRYRQVRGFASDGLLGTLTHTGGGGYGAYDGPWNDLSLRVYRKNKTLARENRIPEPNIYSYDYSFFLEDWPELKYWHEKAETLGALMDQDLVPEFHRFGWDDPEQTQQDWQLMQQMTEMTDA